MHLIQKYKVFLLAGSALVGMACLSAGSALAAQAGAAQAGAAQVDDRALLLQRLQQLEQRLNAVEGRPAAAPSPAAGEALDTKAILDRLNAIDERLSNLETSAVLSEPKIIVKQVEVYVDQNGNQYDEPGPGRRAVTTYQRERVFRRQTIEEAIGEALEEEAASGIEVGVSSVTTSQAAFQTHGTKIPADGHVYGVSQADISFAANSAALNTSFYADVVAIGGPPPDNEIPAVNLLNSQTARLSNNQLNLREAWLRTELFNQVVALSVGQLDLTNYFDRNAVANDETSQFISDALVNDPVLGLSANGLGAAVVIDPRGSWNFKLGIQQSDPSASSLSDSLYKLAEIGYLARPFGLQEGNYRVWGRLDNSTGKEEAGYGVSFDQKISPTVTIFGRYGNGYLGSIGDRMVFISGGLGFQAPLTFNPLDTWGVGYAHTDIKNGPHENLVEGYYNLHLTDHLALSFMLQYVVESSIRSGFLLPGVRMGVNF